MNKHKTTFLDTSRSSLDYATTSYINPYSYDDSEEKIIGIINQLRPYINSDGGDIEYIKYESYYVYVKLYGACADCSLQDNTIQNTIYEAIKEDVPQCRGVINVEL